MSAIGELPGAAGRQELGNSRSDSRPMVSVVMPIRNEGRSIERTLGAVLKYQDDIAKLQGSEAKRLLDEARASLEPA